MKSQTTLSDTNVETSLDFLQYIMRDCPRRDFAVRFWDGTVWGPETEEEPRCTLILNHPGALRNMFLPLSDLTLGEAFIYSDFDIEGDIEELFRVGEILINSLNRTRLLNLGSRLLTLPSNRKQSNGRGQAHLKGRPHSKRRDRQAVTYHYDVSNDFYRLWLGERMVYSCAYFQTLDDDLETAQEAKLDYICRKLRLQPGERLLDIGCGWGGLIIYAAQNYGIIAEGITLSAPQAKLANERICDADLTDRCHVSVRDYRDLGEDESYDKAVSVGMFEHVGSALLRTYFEKAWRLLKPGGVFLNHGIAHRLPKRQIPIWTGPSFINTYVFPDGELTTISESLMSAEQAGFEVRDVESLREHYMLTLRHWVRNLESHHNGAVLASDEVTYRIWRLFMAASAYGFQKEYINVYQSLLTKPDNGDCRLPLTRDDWYI